MDAIVGRRARSMRTECSIGLSQAMAGLAATAAAVRLTSDRIDGARVRLVFLAPLGAH